MLNFNAYETKTIPVSKEKPKIKKLDDALLFWAKVHKKLYTEFGRME